MEKVIKTPADIKPVGTVDQYGNQAYLVKFTDNASGFFRTPKQDLFTIGQPAEFEFGAVPKKDGTGTYFKIQRVQKDFESKGKKDGMSPEEMRHRNKSMALSYAKDHIGHWITSQRTDMKASTPGDILMIAQDWFDWLNDDDERDLPRPKPEEKTEFPTEDELPF